MSFQIEQKLGRLFFTLCRMRAAKADQLMEQMGLFRGQAVLLMVLSAHEGITHSEVAEKLAISPAAATKVIKRMENLQYLQRRADPSDERVSRVYLLDKGRAVINQIQASFQTLDRVTFSGLSTPEMLQLSELLDRIHTNLHEGDFICNPEA
jgi:DNA-binding MarR family transcriptional regulator